MQTPKLIGFVLAVAIVGCGRAQPQPASTPAATLESFVFTTEDGATTRFWLADPAKPSVRRLIQAFDHEQNWAGVASVSPDGNWIAHTLLPRGERDPDRAAQLLLTNLHTRQSRTLATGVDLRSTLVWAPDGGLVTFQRFEGQQQQVWVQPVSGDAAGQSAAPAVGERLIPVGFSGPAGQILGVRLSARGVDLDQFRQGATPEQVSHLTDGTARDFMISPGGGRLAFLATSLGDPAPVSGAYVLDLGASAPHRLPSEWGEIIGLAWKGDGTLVVASTGADAALRTESGDKLPSAGTRGFLQPLGWAPSGRYLAVRVFSGESASDPGTARDALLTQRGKLVSITETLPVRFVGWVAGGGQNAGR